MWKYAYNLLLYDKKQDRNDQNNIIKNRGGYLFKNVIRNSSRFITKKKSIIIKGGIRDKILNDRINNENKTFLIIIN